MQMQHASGGGGGWVAWVLVVWVVWVVGGGSVCVEVLSVLLGFVCVEMW